MLEGKKSVSSWKEKNVTLKEKHLHAKKKQALFQLCFTKFSQKNILIKCDYRKNLFKNDFFKESLKNISKGVRSTKMSSCNLR
jgi:hypothetical protein